MPWARASGSLSARRAAPSRRARRPPRAPDPRGDHGDAGGHRLEQHVGQPLAQRGQHRHRRPATGSRRRRAEAGEHDPPLEPEARTLGSSAPGSLRPRRCLPDDKKRAARVLAVFRIAAARRKSSMPLLGLSRDTTATSGHPSGRPSSRRSAAPSAGCRSATSSTPFWMTVILACVVSVGDEPAASRPRRSPRCGARAGTPRAGRGAAAASGTRPCPGSTR